ncbi:hypothetical protein Tco_0281102 [Tanacetum coccineum]
MDNGQSCLLCHWSTLQASLTGFVCHDSDRGRMSKVPYANAVVKCMVEIKEARKFDISWMQIILKDLDKIMRLQKPIKKKHLALKATNQSWSTPREIIESKEIEVAKIALIINALTRLYKVVPGPPEGSSIAWSGTCVVDVN